MDADVDAIGFDLVANRDQTVYNVHEYGTKDDIALGLVDGQNTLVEVARDGPRPRRLVSSSQTSTASTPSTRRPTRKRSISR